MLLLSDLPWNGHESGMNRVCMEIDGSGSSSAGKMKHDRLVVDGGSPFPFPWARLQMNRPMTRRNQFRTQCDCSLVFSNIL